jgi:hypothetical protein
MRGFENTLEPGLVQGLLFWRAAIGVVALGGIGLTPLLTAEQVPSPAGPLRVISGRSDPRANARERPASDPRVV